jgi:CTP synthase
MRFVVVTGGVISGIGKGITSSSIGLLLQRCGLAVTAVKIDPYLNIDAGTMSPWEHGECYVLRDGGEADLDLGNYERFLGVTLTSAHNITTGKVYQRVLAKERAGLYLGQTVQVTPHVVDEALAMLHEAVGAAADVCMVELGGTLGDIESLPFVEALRMLAADRRHQCCFVHVAMIVDNGEYKTKPAQHSVATMRGLGLQPDLLVLRCPARLPHAVVAKLHRQCQVPPECIVSNTDVPTIYSVPRLFLDQGVHARVAERIAAPLLPPALDDYNRVLAHYAAPAPLVRVAIVGKYVGTNDTYLSIVRALEHAAVRVAVAVVPVFVDSGAGEWPDCHAVVIPGGFGARGIDGKLAAARQCRERGTPCLGICLGLQVMVAEWWRHAGLGADAGSAEWGCASPALIDILPGQDGRALGGTMRLGAHTTHLAPGTVVARAYGAAECSERHRHRYEVNPACVARLRGAGLVIAGTDAAGLVEAVEAPDHPFYVGVQFHPEFQTTFAAPHPLFVALLAAARRLIHPVA